MKTALLLIDHGSVRAEANALLADVARLLRELSGFAIIEHAHMELAEPTIVQGFDSCVAAGAGTIIVHPYFLAPGRHSTRDIPRLVADAAARHPAVQYRVSEPLGLHVKIAEVVLERAAQATNAPAGRAQPNRG
jgi:sirohydrochlorin ferrochelatase